MADITPFPNARGGLERRGEGNDNGNMDDALRRVTALEADVKVLVGDVAEIKGELSNMPTTFQTVSRFVGVSIGLTGLAFAIARVTAPRRVTARP